jgi:hypothetical protein
MTDTPESLRERARLIRETAQGFSLPVSHTLFNLATSLEAQAEKLDSGPPQIIPMNPTQE